MLRSVCLQLIFNIHQSIILGHALASRRSTRFEVAGAKADGEVCDEVVGGFAGAMGDEDGPAGCEGLVGAG